MARRGEPLTALLFRTTFLPKLVISFIANYGSGTLYTNAAVYAFYLLVFAAGILGMIFCMIMPFLLLIQYSYTVDYQAQGRYIMPGVIPLMYYISRGPEKLPLWRKASEKQKNILSALALAGILLSLLVTVYVSALPYYLKASVL